MNLALAKIFLRPGGVYCYLSIYVVVLLLAFFWLVFSARNVSLTIEKKFGFLGS